MKRQIKVFGAAAIVFYLGSVLVGLGLWVGIVCAAVHFIRKWW